jgi:SM-20-related protein
VSEVESALAGGALPRPSRSAFVDGRPVAVFDGLLDAATIAEYVRALAITPFKRIEAATPQTAGYKHWISEMSMAQLRSLPLAPVTAAALHAVRPDRHWRAYRAYTNHAAFGDMLFTHTDCAPEADEFTALWYLCDEWDPEWGGETMFYDASGDAVACVSPRPGRLALFHGAIRHAGRPPNRICYAPRYTFAIKLEAIPEGGATPTR